MGRKFALKIFDTDGFIYAGFTLPQARNSNLVTQKIDDGILIYDLSINKAHHLNQISSKIWEKCDGKTSFDEVTKFLKADFNIKIEPELILLAIKEFDKSDLLEDNTDKFNLKHISRREVIIKSALSAAAIPLVLSLAVPTSAQAGGRCLEEGAACITDFPGECCSGICGFSGGGGGSVCQPAPTPV